MNEKAFRAKARIRGIYSTALTKLLLEKGFQIVQPSLASEERFGLTAHQEPPDLDIYDRLDLHGLHVLGKRSAIDAFSSMLKTQLDDVILRRWDVSVNGIYKGVVTKLNPERGVALVDIGTAVGRLPRLGANNVETKEIIVQVQRRRLGVRRPLLSTNITIPGDYAVLSSQQHIKISRRIRDHRIRARLYELGKKLQHGRGIIWRTAAASQSPDRLQREIADLEEKQRTIKEKAERVTAPALLYEENYFMDVEFPALSKRRLDEIRSTVAPTINGHHFYKICGGEISSAVDMAELLLERGRRSTEVEELFTKTVEAAFPYNGSTIEIEHVKPDGNIFHLGQAHILSFDPDTSLIKYCRIFKKRGVYNGLETLKEEGDRAVTETRIGEWYLKTRYFSKDERSKGIYINLNTPVELYPHGIRYVDLEVDIVVHPNGEVTALDEDRLEKGIEEGYISETLAKKVRTKLKELIEKRGKDEA
ncbi:MAG: ribonuclease E/G [Candidatus Bathyarchaeota archaeon]|nr:MAG: ribonuclease E/G [Candidatus Bathyarchaeota archaeon]